MKKLYMHIKDIRESKFLECDDDRIILYQYDFYIKSDAFRNSIMGLFKSMKSIDQIIQIGMWVYNNTKHDGKAQTRSNIEDIKTPMNCYNIAQLLNAVYLSAGYEARMIQLLSSSRESFDCHWVNLVSWSQKQKWVMIDATFGAYCSSFGIPLSIDEIRSKIGYGESFSINSFGNMNAREYYYILSTVCYQFNSFLISSIDPLHEKNQMIINLSPTQFDDEAYYECLCKSKDLGLFSKLLLESAMFVKNRQLFWNGRVK